MGDFLDDSNRFWHWVTVTIAGVSGAAAVLAKPYKRWRAARKALAELPEKFDQFAGSFTVRMDRNTWLTLQTLNQSRSCSFESNLKGECTFVSYEWSKLTGYSMAEAMGFGWTFAICENDISRVLAARKEAFDNHRPFLCRYHYCPRGGARIYVEVRESPMTGQDGKPIGYYFGHVVVDPDENRNGATSAVEGAPVDRPVAPTPRGDRGG